MKNKLSIFLLGLIAAFTFAACEEEAPVFDGPYRLIFLGPQEVVPGETAVYSIGDMVDAEAYTWTVEGPAAIVGDATGTTVEVEFLGVGDVVLGASNGTISGTYEVAVAGVEPAVTASLTGTGVLANEMSDTVFFAFDAPLAEDPNIEMVTEEGAFVSGTLGELTAIDPQNYFVVYTAGEGNGTPEVLLTEITATDEFGATTVDSAFVSLYRVDNFNPIVDVTFSDDTVMAGENVAVTANFNEEVMNANPEDSVLYITFTVNGEMMRDTLEATADPLVYTFDYTAEGDGIVEVGFENIADLAGNAELVVVSDDLRIDNTAPEIIETATGATDEGDYAEITITSTEAGTGMYVIMDSAAEPVTNAEEFSAAEGVASGSVELRAGDLLFSGSDVESLEAGDYTVYYMVMDMAGNTSSITSSALIMD
ncbi:hypothetical protein [Nafulsella turpanensis]|uniref:hypothetical protein n=1 Tax=Nafulsella turpanensis TaxID=1265690 RepID=UPI000346F0B8|nr:hypothetical protein [Nafulsella turpanensis]